MTIYAEKITDDKKIVGITKSAKLASEMGFKYSFEEHEVEQAYDGSWYLEGYAPEKPAPTYEEVKATRANLYASEVDPLMSEYTRKKTFNLFEEGEEDTLLREIEILVAEIKEDNPYPTEESY